MKKVLLDTDTISYFFRNNHNVRVKVDNYIKIHQFVNISVITYYEVLNGLYYKDAKKQLQRFLEFSVLNKILPLTKESAKISAKISSHLRTTGKTVDHNDILIAGIAIENNFTLITNNSNHFARIPDLEIENWSI